MQTDHIQLNCHSTAEFNAYKTLGVISAMYQGRTDYRIIGGQMVNLLLAVYPKAQSQPRTTQDVDTAIDDFELLFIADEQLVHAGFTQVAGGVYKKEIQEINYLTSDPSPKPGIRPVSVPGTASRQIDALPELELVLMSEDYHVIEASVTAPQPEKDFGFTVLVPSVNHAVLLKAQTVVSRGYLDKDLKDLLTLFEIQDAYAGNITWKYLDSEPIGRHKDTVQNLKRLSSYLRRKTVDGFPQERSERLRELTSNHIAQ